MTRVGRAALVVVLAACDPTFEPPAAPAHDDSRDGVLHAALAEHPFRCPTGEPRPATSGRREERDVPNTSCAVTSTRPTDARLSCDSIGCHGGFDHTTDPLTTARHLRGSNGPSCYTCHGEEWDTDR